MLLYLIHEELFPTLIFNRLIMNVSYILYLIHILLYIHIRCIIKFPPLTLDGVLRFSRPISLFFLRLANMCSNNNMLVHYSIINQTFNLIRNEYRQSTSSPLHASVFPSW